MAPLTLKLCPLATLSVSDPPRVDVTVALVRLPPDQLMSTSKPPLAINPWALPVGMLDAGRAGRR